MYVFVTQCLLSFLRTAEYVEKKLEVAYLQLVSIPWEEDFRDSDEATGSFLGTERKTCMIC